ncbi:unnamed protein product [Citrullus colocynthis]|uniref:non-specific serine/threonine protein kinase n=1 Tax=Citrullus colocynthis TaxID=252529 RepID=A0ABP0YIM3_9ROSI
MEKYEVVKDLGSGSFGIAKLCRHKQTKDLVAVKFIERGPMVFLTPTHLALVMEYAAGGELFQRICKCGRFSEDERCLLRISGVGNEQEAGLDTRKEELVALLDYNSLILFVTGKIFLPATDYWSQQICHRDLKLDNILIDGGLAPRLKICDFGYSKSCLFHSRPKSTVGSPSYAAPEVLAQGEYDGKLADVWSCGVTLYFMLVGEYPFDDQNDTGNLERTYKRIMNVQYKIPTNVKISQDCRHLLSRIFVGNPSRRVLLRDITRHPWYIKNLPRELTEPAQAVYYKRDNPSFSLQSLEEIMQIVKETRNPPPSSTTNMSFGWETEEDGTVKLEEEDDEIEQEEEDDEVEQEEEDDDEVEEEEQDDEVELEEENNQGEQEEEDDYEVEEEEEDDEVELEEEEDEYGKMVKAKFMPKENT